MRKLIIISIITLAVVGGAVGFGYIRATGNSPRESVVVKRGNLTQEVLATGRVEPPTKINLRFKNSGKLVVLSAKSGKKVAAGQLLAEQDIGALNAQLAEMQAGVDVSKAKLEQLIAGASSEDVQISETAVANADVSVSGARQAVEDARRSFLDKLQDAYTKSDDAIRGKADQLFTNPLTMNPKFIVFSADSSLVNDIEWSRLLIENNVFRVWKTSLDQITVSDDLSEYANTTRKYLDDIKVFLDKVALALNNPNSMYVISGTSQTMPSNWKTDISTARTNLNIAISNLSAAESNLKTAEAGLSAAQGNLKTAQDQLTMKKAPARQPDITLGEAQIRQAEAQMQRIQAQIQEMIIIAPASGTITGTTGEVGEIITPDIEVVSLMPNGNLQIKVDVSESDIVNVKVGQEAKIILDAFGNDVEWVGKVANIDPAETTVGGAIYYKTTVLFVDNDERIKPGMTANVLITSANKEGVLYIPADAVKSKPGKKPTDSRLYPYVQILEGSQVKEKDVQTGMKGGNGMIEIVSGLNESEQVILQTNNK